MGSKKLALLQEFAIFDLAKQKKKKTHKMVFPRTLLFARFPSSPSRKRRHHRIVASSIGFVASDLA
jgi:hypothetical protein